MKGGVREDRAHLGSHISWWKRIVSECVRAWGGSGVTLAILGSPIMRECIQLALLGNNSIMSGTAPSELCYGRPGEVRENRRVIDEPRIARRVCKYASPTLHLPHDASNNHHHGNECQSTRRLRV